MSPVIQSVRTGTVLGATSCAAALLLLWITASLPREMLQIGLGGLAVLQVMTEYFASRVIPDLTTLLSKTEFSVEQRRKLEALWTRERSNVRKVWITAIIVKALVVTLAASLSKLEEGSLWYLRSLFVGYSLLAVSLWMARDAYRQMLRTEARRSELARRETEVRERKQLLAQLGTVKPSPETAEMKAAIASYSKPSRKLKSKVRSVSPRPARG